MRTASTWRLAPQSGGSLGMAGHRCLGRGSISIARNESFPGRHHPAAPVPVCGVAALAAVFAVATGIIGAALGKYILDAVQVRDWRARGFALGLAAHGIGTARAFQVNAEAGTYAGLAFGLHGVLAAFALPFLWRFFRFLAGGL